MAFCNVNEVIPKNMLAVIPDKYKGMKYKKLKAGDEITIYGVTIVSYKAKKDGEYIVRKDGSNVLNQSIYLEIDNDCYAYLKNDIALMQIAIECKWIEHGESEDYYKFDTPHKVRMVEKSITMGKKVQKPVTVLGFEEIE